jgi:predicted nucleic acid-binding protein
MILVDTNAWIRHLRSGDRALSRFLLEQRVRTCDVVLGELLLGSGVSKTTLADLVLLPRVPSPTSLDTRAFIERHLRSFAGSGVGWADAQIVVAAHQVGARLHTSDRAVQRLCRRVGVETA